MSPFKKIITLCLFISHSMLLSQNEASKWYFGLNAGLDFMTSPPTILTNGMLTTLEGCATISDGAGNLLFYTDGITVYDKTHAMMANGTGLLGNSSTTQSGVIVKQPGTGNTYFIFTLAAGGCGLMAYSMVDLTLASGQGSVTVKNTTLAACMTEKLTAVRHCNGTDIWVISHESNTDKFSTYLVTSAGVNSTPVISSIGSVHNAGLGNLKASPNGKKLGLTLYTSAPTAVELFDFDNTTGIVSNSLSLITNITNPYSCDFSPDGTKFYSTSVNKIFQWDLCAGSSTAIIASQFSITGTSVYGMQLAMDGKIYVSRHQQQTIGVINSPNTMGSGCNYVDLGQSIAPKICQLGFPNFITSFFKPVPPPFTYTTTCQSVAFTAPQVSGTVASGCSFVTNSVTGMTWNFGEPASAGSNTSTLSNPTHMYASLGTYTVKLVLNYACSADTITLPVTISAGAPTLSVAGNFSICSGDKRTYTASGASTYQWHNNAVTPTISINPTVTASYSVTGTGTNTCKSSKIFTITVSKCTGIDEWNNGEELNIYPNPAHDNLTVEIMGKVKLIILDQAGIVVYESSLESGKHSIDISRYSSGVYTLQSFTEKRVKMIRLVKIE